MWAPSRRAPCWTGPTSTAGNCSCRRSRGSAAGSPTRCWHRCFVNDPDIGGQLVVVKVLPPGETAEPRAHRRAIREAPEKFKVRLVRQIFEPYAMPPPGGVLTFQGLAGGSAEWRPLADVPAEHIPAACAFLTRSLIAEWNPRFGVQKVGIVDFLRREIGVEGSVRRHLEEPETLPSTLWLRSDQDPPLPSPLPLIGPESLFGDALVDVVVGRVHSDLHDLNVLLRQRDDNHWIDTFVLVDLMTYDPAGQLGRDLVRLLLSVTGRRLPDLSERQRTLLLSAFVRPDETWDLPSFAIDPLYAIYQTAAAELSRAGREVWRQQFLLSLIAQGMVDDDLRELHPDRALVVLPAGRVRGPPAGAGLPLLDRCAARGGAGQQPVRAAGPAPGLGRAGGSGPDGRSTGPARSGHGRRAAKNGPAARNDPAANHDPASTTTRPRRTTRPPRSARCATRLGADWAALATRFEIPQQERSRFRSGRKPYAVWEWIEREGRLHELPRPCATWACANWPTCWTVTSNDSIPH